MYFPTMSASRFTRSPRRRVPRFVCASVCGIVDTEKPVASTVATVRLMPSIVMEPFSTT